MLVRASKYSDVRAAAGRPSPPAATRPALPGVRGPHVSSPAPKALPPKPQAPAILVPTRKGRGLSFPEWFQRELREGGYLQEYLRREKAMTQRRYRCVRAMYDNYRHNGRSDWKLLAAVPARDFHRWKKEDPDFWRDDANLRSLRRDNPDTAIFV